MMERTDLLMLFGAGAAGVGEVVLGPRDDEESGLLPPIRECGAAKLVEVRRRAFSSFFWRSAMVRCASAKLCSLPLKVLFKVAQSASSLALDLDIVSFS